MKKIAIEKGLSQVGDYLSKSGFDVQEFEMNTTENSSYYDQFDAVVVTGQSLNVMGYSDTTTKVPQIIADGQTAEEIKNKLDKIPTT